MIVAYWSSVRRQFLCLFIRWKTDSCGEKTIHIVHKYFNFMSLKFSFLRNVCNHWMHLEGESSYERNDVCIRCRFSMVY